MQNDEISPKISLTSYDESMIDDEAMAGPKDIKQMSYAERVTAFVLRQHEPDAVVFADDILRTMVFELKAFSALRNQAANQHGVPEIAPLSNTAPAPLASGAAPDALRLSEMTIEALVGSYRIDPRSPYAALRFKSRESYDVHLNRIVKDMGNLSVARLKAPDIKRIYDAWTDNGTRKLPIAHGRITMLRGVINFGAEVLEDEKCQLLAFALHQMNFAIPKPRTVRLSTEQAALIMDMAPKLGAPSIAFAQALQLDCGLSQIDTIGQWVPINEEPDQLSSVRDPEGNKWLRGIRWERLDQNLVLHHVLSFSGKEATFRLSKAPFVMEQLEKIYGGTTRDKLPADGPMIVREVTGLPWQIWAFRQQWRRIARACKIPNDVRNMDTGRKSGASDDDDDEGEGSNKDRPADADWQTAGPIQ